MTITRSSLAAIGIAGVLAAGAAIPAIAQDDTATEDTTTDETTREDRKAAAEEAFAEALATELGLDTDTVADALTTVREDMRAAREAERDARVQERLDELVESGELTQEEADTLAEVRDRGVFGDGIGRRHVHRHGGGFMGGPGGDAATDEAATDTTSA